MPYYVRILTPATHPVASDAIASALIPLDCKLSGDVSLASWTQLEVTEASGEALFFIERNEVQRGSLAEEEILEFQDEIADCLPASAADWLRAYLPTVRTIYSFQILDGVYSGNGWDIVGAAKGAIWTTAGGIFQADGEGFSNEDGFHVLWQFSEDVSGDWSMAIIEDGDWKRFKMDLGNPDHRSAFRAGQVPKGVERV